MWSKAQLLEALAQPRPCRFNPPGVSLSQGPWAEQQQEALRRQGK